MSVVEHNITDEFFKCYYGRKIYLLSEKLEKYLKKGGIYFLLALLTLTIYGPILIVSSLVGMPTFMVAELYKMKFKKYNTYCKIILTIPAILVGVILAGIMIYGGVAVVGICIIASLTCG